MEGELTHRGSRGHRLTRILEFHGTKSLEVLRFNDSDKTIK